MRFSELNGLEEYDNTHIFMDWQACFEYGLQQLFDWKEWINRQKDDQKLWEEVPPEQKKSIERTLTDLDDYELELPCTSEENVKVISNKLQKYNWNLWVGVLTLNGQIGILNGRMAREKGHKKDLLKVTENRKERDKEIQMGSQDKKHFWNRD